jgi:hypothetical protein
LCTTVNLAVFFIAQHFCEKAATGALVEIRGTGWAGGRRPSRRAKMGASAGRIDLNVPWSKCSHAAVDMPLFR